MNWFQTVYTETRHYNPLTWAMAIAFVGDTRPSELELQYSDAANRKPQWDLFGPGRYGVKRSRAPIQLYKAFESAERKQHAIDSTGLSQSEVDGWLKRDNALAEHWRSSLRERRHRRAVATISAFVEGHPDCMRVDVLKNCLQAYRWLEANDVECFDQLLPKVQPKYSRQMDLPLSI